MRILVVGGVAAGMSAASRAKHGSPGAEVVVFERGAHVSYGACGLPYVIGGVTPEFGDLIARTPNELRGRGLSLRTGQEVTGIDARARTVTVRSDAGTRSEPYDQLLLATGVRAVRPDWSRTDLAGIHTLRDIPDGEQIQASLKGAKRAAIIGGGYIGLEMAEALRAHGLSVVLIERNSGVAGHMLDPSMAALVLKELERQHVDVRLNTVVTGLTGQNGRVTGVQTADGLVRADLVIVAVGVQPNSELGRAAGVRAGPSGGLRTDARCRTSVPGIWAAGDVCEVRHQVTRRFVHIPLGLTANRMGRVAGMNMPHGDGGGDARFHGVVGTGIFKAFDCSAARTGLTEREARAAGFDVIAQDVLSQDKPGYYPGYAPLHVRLVAERGSGRLLGGQLVGHESAVKRIDVLASALHHRGRLSDLADYDLAYAPPFSTVWDALLVAAEKTIRACGVAG